MKITALYRHPLKSHGREALDSVTLQAGQSMPFDRTWAVAHEKSEADGTQWAPCVNFSRGSKAPQLMAINARYDADSNLLTLSHYDRPDLTFDPDHDTAAFLEWVRPLVPRDRALPAQILRLPGRGFTDTPFASVSLCNTASNTAVGQHAATELSPLRWRGNIWIDGADAWAEDDWIGRKLRIGGVTLSIREPIVRCLATTANPETGVRDVDTLGVIETMRDHQNFGVYAEVVKSGHIAIGDHLELE